MDTSTNQYVLEEIVLSESDDGDVKYEEVQEEIEAEHDVDEDYETVLRIAKGISLERPAATQLAENKFTQKHVTTDDFIRNFLVRLGMPKTLESFQAEWHELQTKGKLKQQDLSPVPDVYIVNQDLREAVASLRDELESAKLEEERAKSDREFLNRQINIYKERHHRVVMDKNTLNTKIATMKEGEDERNAKYQKLAGRYENAMKEKMLIKLERDRLMNKAEQLEHTLAQSQSEKQLVSAVVKPKQKPKTTPTFARRDTPFPPANRPNPYASVTVPEQKRLESWMLTKTFRGHQAGVSSVALHPRKSIVCTGSDDNTCKVWKLMNCDLLITFEMSDWVACTAFHPTGGYVAAGSADSTVCMWDLANPTKAPSIFRDHARAIWDIDFNDTGDFLLSASMDHTVKLWDCNTGRNRGSYRGHVDSVNSCQFQPYANCFISGSGDKTVSLWDMRVYQCVQTFYGHTNSVSSVSFNLKADTVASSDADGVVKIWDVRMIQEKCPQLDTGRFPVTCSVFDRSGSVLLVGSEDGSIYAFSLETQEVLQTFKGHELGVQDVVFDPGNKFFLSAGSDHTFRVWS